MKGNKQGHKKSAMIFLALVLLYGCAAKQPEGKYSMSLNLQTWVGHGPIYLAKEKGFFDEQNLIVDIVRDEIAENRNFAFKHNLLDAEGSSIDLLIHKRDNEIPVVAVLEIDESLGADGIVAVDSVKDIKGLKGKRIALERKNVGEAFLSYLMYKNGLSLNDVTIIPVGGSDEAATAFLENKSDVAVTWEPWLTKVRTQNNSNLHVLATSKEEPGVIVDLLIVREDYLKNNPQAVKRFLRGWFKALDYIKENPDESIGIMAKVYDMTPEVYKESLQGLKWSSYEDNLEYFDPDKGSLHDIYKQLSEIFLESGSISKTVEPKKAIDAGVLKNLNNE